MSINKLIYQTFSPKNVPLCPSAVIPFPKLPGPVTNLIFISTVLPFLEHHINRIIPFVLSCVSFFHLALHF